MRQLSKLLKNVSTIWKKIICRAESCPKCGSHVCLISDRIFRPRSKFICPSCGCISFTPLFAYLIPIIITLTRLLFEIMEDLNSIWGINYKNLTYDTILVYSISTLCALIIIPLKRKPEEANRQESLRQRARQKHNRAKQQEKEQNHNAFIAMLRDMCKRIGTLFSPQLQEYISGCCEEAKKQVQANLSCPNCGKQVLSARKRILHGPFHTETCPYCKTRYREGLIAPTISAAIGIFVYMNVAVFVEGIKFLPQIVADIISLGVVLPLCLFIPYCTIGALGLLVSPLKELE